MGGEYMRKYLIGFIAGVLVATASVAAADTISLVGKKVQSEAIVTLDGEAIGTALIIDGTSYPPLRVVAEAVGVGVGYEKGVVKLQTQNEKPMSLSYWEGRLEDLNGSLEIAKKLVETAEGRVEKGKLAIEKWQNTLDSLPADASDVTKNEYTTRITNGQIEQLELEADLQARKDRVAEIEQEIIYVKVQIAAAK